MKESTKKITGREILQTVKELLGWRYFPFITAVWVVACYYLEWDLVTFYYMAVTSVLTILLLENLTPLFTNFLFFGIMISVGNSPTTFGPSENPDFLLQPAVMGQGIALICLIVIAMVVRVALTIKRGKFKLTPTFFGLCALSLIFILNGLFSEKYSPMNLLYGLFLALAFLLIFALMKDNVELNEKTFTDIAFSFMALSSALILELLIKYLTAGVISDGVINRNLLGFGWGMYNNLGMYLLLCLPSVMFIAGRHKYGYCFYGYAIIHTVAILMTMSRQAYIGVAVIFPVCLVFLLVKGKNRLANLIITGVILAIAVTLAVVYREKLSTLFTTLCTGSDTLNGRTGLWEEAIKAFKSAPVLGTGFCVELENDPGFAGLSIVPDMYHNTAMQLLASCGILGLLAYAVHRVQTIISLFKNMTLPRIYIAITILSLLILNLLDNHLFYILPTIVYSALVAVLIKSEKKAE